MTDLQRSPGPTPEVVDIDNDVPKGSLWVSAVEFPSGSGRYPVVIRVEGGEALEATVSVEGLRACAKFVMDGFVMGEPSFHGGGPID